MNTIAMIEDLKTVNRRLHEALHGKTTPPAWTAADREQADRIVAGDIHRLPDGQWFHIDLEHVDWNAEDTPNPNHLIMVLRRFYFLSPLAAAYRATNDERYAEAARNYIAAFLRDDPTVDNWQPAPGDGDTQYDIRIESWLGNLTEFSRSPAFDEAFVSEIFKAVRGYMRYLSCNVRPDRNIRFHHGLVLLFAGLRLPRMTEAGAWCQQGIEICNDAVRRQILPDGAHMEATPGYHGGMRGIVDSYWRLARAMPELPIVVPTEKVLAMFDYELAATQPDGAVISLHDTRYAEPVSCPENAMLKARANFRRRAGLPEDTPPCHGLFPHAGQVFFRDDWTTGSAYLTFDAATRRSFHWHPCRNSITLFAQGRALLVDPGYTFESKEFPRYGHRTAHHNTLNLNGWDQSECIAMLRTHAVGSYTLVQGTYGGGYWPLEKSSHGTGIFGSHNRSLLWIRNRFAIVLDSIHHTAVEGLKPTVETCWQLSQGPAECDPAARRIITRHDTGNLRIDFPLVLPDTEISIHEGERNPMRGWLPTEWGRICVPAPLVRVTASAYDPWHGDLATVLTPFAGSEAPVLRVSATGPDAVRDSRKAGCLEIVHADGSRDRIIWTRALEHAIDRQHDLQTDGSLLCLHHEPDGTIRDGLLVDGTYCRMQNKDLGDRLTMLDRLTPPETD